MLANLIGNGIKFTDTGKIDIRLSLSADSAWVILEVEDSGIGISAEDRASIFEQFRQGSHKRSGNGLGLHLCHQIIMAHRGTIEVQSQLNKGTVFKICLPLVA